LFYNFKRFGGDMANNLVRKNQTLITLVVICGSLGLSFGLMPVLDLTLEIAWLYNEEVVILLRRLINFYYVSLQTINFLAPLIGLIFCISALATGFIAIANEENRHSRFQILFGVILGSLGIMGNLISFYYFIIPD
jgi:hypothetical protein